MTPDDLIPITNITPELIDEVARLPVPPHFFTPVGIAVGGSKADCLFTSPQAFACLRIGYVLACAMIKRESKAA